jgi:hypothetical protein
MSVFVPRTSPAVAHVQPLKANTSFLEKTNPKLSKLIADQPGVGKFLERLDSLGLLSTGASAGEVETPIDWMVWTHSTATNAKYGHGMKTEQIMKDVIVTWAHDASVKNSIPLGYRSNQGKVVAIHRMSDLRAPSVAMDGGLITRMPVLAPGKPGATQQLSWAIVSLDDTGAVRGGGFPSTVPANEYLKPGGGRPPSGGGEYAGRSFIVTHGKPNHVPIIND